MPHMLMDHFDDPKETILKEIGDLSEVKVFNNQVLVAVYIRPQKTKSGIWLSENTVDEDRYQSKVGMVLKMGAQAFSDDSGSWFKDMNIKEGDWVIHRPSDGWSITVNNVLCRMLDDTNIRGSVSHPDHVW